MRQWTAWAMVLLVSGSARIAAAETDLCYEYLMNNKNDQAIEACTKDLQSGAYDGDKRIVASRLYYRGKAYFGKLGKRNYDRAISDITKAIRLFPDNLSSDRTRSFYDTRASVYLWAGRYDQAIADYKKLLSYRDYRKWQHALATAYWLKGDYEKAVAEFTAGTKPGASENAMDLANYVAPVYQERGDLYYSLGQYENAIADFTKALELNLPDEASARLQMWLALNKLSPERAESYREELQKAVNDSWLGNMAKYYLGTEGLTEKDVLDKARHDDQLCETYYYLGEARLMRGDRKGAEAFFKKCIGTETHYSCYQKYMAKVLLKRKTYKSVPAPAPEEQTRHYFKRGATRCGTSIGNFGSF